MFLMQVVVFTCIFFVMLAVVVNYSHLELKIIHNNHCAHLKSISSSEMMRTLVK